MKKYRLYYWTSGCVKKLCWRRGGQKTFDTLEEAELEGRVSAVEINKDVLIVAYDDKYASRIVKAILKSEESHE